MTNEELRDAEERYSLTFPPELRSMLSVALPNNFYQWNSIDPDDVTAIRESLAWPLESLIFSLTHDNDWYPGWGERPFTDEGIIEVITREYASAPPLIPLMGHRYLSLLDGVEAPVLSVYGSDIIYYGADLETWVEFEYFFSNERGDLSTVPELPFWDIFIHCLYD